ncbi:hypothetical protein [Thermococcus sp.]
MKKLVGISLISMFLFSPAFHVIEAPRYIAGMPIQKLVPLYVKGKPYFDALDEVTKTLTQTDCIIVTQNMLFPHLANRKNTYYIVTPFKSVYVPNNSIIVVEAVLPDYKFTISSFENYTEGHEVDFKLVNTTTLILQCSEEYLGNISACIFRKLENIIQKCHKEK